MPHYTELTEDQKDPRRIRRVWSTCNDSNCCTPLDVSGLLIRREVEVECPNCGEVSFFDDLRDTFADLVEDGETAEVAP